MNHCLIVLVFVCCGEALASPYVVKLVEGFIGLLDSVLDCWACVAVVCQYDAQVSLFCGERDRWVSGQFESCAVVFKSFFGPFSCDGQEDFAFGCVGEKAILFL